MNINMLFQVLFIVIFICLSVIIINLHINFYNSKRIIKDLLKENDFFINSLKHDLKVAVLAQQRALEILPILNENEQKSIIQNLTESNQYSIDMIEMISNINSINKNDSLNSDIFDFNELVVSVSKNIIKSDCKNNFEISTKTDKTKQLINVDKERVQKVLQILLQLVLTRADNKKMLEIGNKSENGKIIFSITYSPKNDLFEESKTILNENPKYGSVGQGLKITYCKKVLNYYNSKLEIFDINKDTLKIGFILFIK